MAASKDSFDEDRSVTCQDIKLIMPTVIILLFTLFIMVTVIPYAFSAVIKQLQGVWALEEQSKFVIKIIVFSFSVFSGNWSCSQSSFWICGWCNYIRGCPRGCRRNNCNCVCLLILNLQNQKMQKHVLVGALWGHVEDVEKLLTYIYFKMCDGKWHFWNHLVVQD